MESNVYAQEIDLKDLLFVVLHKWRRILLVAVVFAVLLGGVKGALAYRNQIDPENVKMQQETFETELQLYESNKETTEREIENLKENIQKQQIYLDESVKMNISPYDVCEARADIFIKTDYQILPGMVYQNADYTATILQAYQTLLTSNIVLDEIAEKLGIDAQHLSELISVECGKAVLSGSDIGKFTNLLTVKAIHKSEKKAKEVLDALLAHMDELEVQIIESIGEHSVSVVNSGTGSYVDMTLSGEQKAATDNLSQLQSSLKDKETKLAELKEPKAPTSSVMTAVKSAIKYAVFGGVLGTFIVVFFVCVTFLLSDKLYAVKEIRKRYGLKVLGVLPLDENQKKGKIDSWLNRLEGHATIDGANSYSMIAANLENLCGGTKHILVTGSVDEDQIARIKEELSGRLSNLQLQFGENMLQCADTLKKLSECDGVVLIEAIGKATYSVIGQEVDAVCDLGKVVVGCIVLE